MQTPSSLSCPLAPLSCWISSSLQLSLSIPLTPTVITAQGEGKHPKGGEDRALLIGMWEESPTRPETLGKIKHIS